MKVVLMVAEKPSLASSIAKILSRGTMQSRKSASTACQVHEFVGPFRGEPSVRFKMTSVCGHVMSLDFQGRYNNWEAVEPGELFGAPTIRKEANPNLHIEKFLQLEGRGVDYLVLWLDCDKEGENICFEVINAVQSGMKSHSRGEQTIYRAHFSSITERDINQAMKQLGSPNHNEARSVDARQELDLRIGCAFTRFQTKFFQGKYGDLDSSVISYGPCQTPTLGFCVDRHDKIQSFKPESYWQLHVQIRCDSQLVSLEWERGRIFDKEVVQVFMALVKQTTTAKVLSVQQKEKSKSRPLPLNTVEMLRVASSGLNIGPQHTMQLAERLYTQGYISYPRTETTHFAENFDIRGTLKEHVRHPSWGGVVNSLLGGNMQKPKKGHDAGDHPPITPTRCATESEIGGGDAWRLYQYITQHFIATVSPDCSYIQTTAQFDINGEQFSCSGKRVTDPGYTALLTWQAVLDSDKMPALTKGQTHEVTDVKIVDKQTSPPAFLTESELISLMEKHGIGTDASISVHINNICERNYVRVEAGRQLIPTSLGIVLVHGYQKIDPDLVLPTMRSAVEQQLNLIAAGNADYDSVLSHALGIFTHKYEYFVQHVNSMDELFEVSFSKLADTGRPMSRCGLCRHFMKFVQAKPSRLYCQHCDTVYALPQNGTIKLYKELKCPLDDFELVLWSTGAKGKSTPVCPYCYNHPPFNDMKKGMSCGECSHPTCPHALSQSKVCSCLECDQGFLLLDMTSGPKWKMACNRCNVLVHFFENASRVSTVRESCPDCGTVYLEAAFKAPSPLASGELECRGCVFCDAALSSLVQVHHAVAQHPMYHRRRGRGRGRGRRGGRGRGRGGRGPKDKMAQLDAYFV
ncbi:DNA topoisomerase 3-beta-1-like [Corticium candelabrum]|uniref:DNA topoisomerase 3-beta-1-like n=1 Tax=Corticium candelabrum TaxID=121492 RepID=UPI002E26D549|nr:DNA topoisomerase 3-beta-1-like [Corticium candelabrum]